MNPDDSNHLPHTEKDKSSSSKKSAKPSAQRPKNNNEDGWRTRQHDDNHENLPTSSEDVNREQSQPVEQSGHSSRVFRTNTSHSNSNPIRSQNAVSTGGGGLNIVRSFKNNTEPEGSGSQTYSQPIRPFPSSSRGAGVRARFRTSPRTVEGETHNGHLAATRKTISPTRQTGHMRSDKHHSPRRNRSNPTAIPPLRFSGQRDPSPHPNNSSPPLDVMGSPESPLPPMFSHIRPGLYSPHNPFMMGLGTEDNPYDLSTGLSDNTGLLSDEEIARQLQEEEWDAAGSFSRNSGSFRSRRNLPSLRRPRTRAHVMGSYMEPTIDPIPSGSRLVEALDFGGEPPMTGRRARTYRADRMPSHSRSHALRSQLDLLGPFHFLHATLQDSHDDMTPFIYDLIQHYGISDLEIQSWLNPGAVGDPVMGDYESLLALAERLGEVSRGLTDSEISQLPTSKHQGQALGGEGASAMPDDLPQCNICLTDYEHGDKMRNLPCKHDFHKDCVDQWLKTNATCPICRAEVKKKRT